MTWYFDNGDGSDNQWANTENWFCRPVLIRQASAPAGAPDAIWIDTDDGDKTYLSIGGVWVESEVHPSTYPWTGSDTFGDDLSLVAGFSGTPPVIESWVSIGPAANSDPFGTCDIPYITNEGTIYNGHFTGDHFTSCGYLDGGVDYGPTISGDYFTNGWPAPGFIYGGTFIGDYATNSDFGEIQGGTFGGEFFTNGFLIFGGVFTCDVDSAGEIYGGSFRDQFQNNIYGTIGAGVFTGPNFFNDGTVNGGIFSIDSLYNYGPAFSSAFWLESGTLVARFNEGTSPNGDLAVGRGGENFYPGVFQATLTIPGQDVLGCGLY